ncbi:MAG: hypothetical protein OEQ94_10375 [Nitrosopumilus sp.]|nr:hypothetical protein [Nitrosopumilus sp.]MDH3834750.1 hypothetical protein [Nitrosopumilus sp.]
MNLILVGIIIILGSALTIVIVDDNQTKLSYESLLNEKLQVEELINTFKEKYSEYEIMEFPDSKGVPYKYLVKASYTDVELILEKDIVLRAWTNDGGPICLVSNPYPRDILNNCPLKW